MNILTPLTGLLVALAVIPPLILLYFLKLRRKPQAISCTLLWQRSVEDLRANAPFQRLRASILLFLQLLALLLLAAALMQPQLQGGRLEGGRTIIIIDNSASMNASDVEDADSRLDLAKTLARARVEELHSGGVFSGDSGETMVIAFSDRAEVYSQFTDSKGQLLSAIDRIQPTHGATSIDEALKLARAHTTNVVDNMGEARPTGDPGTLELYSDGNILDLTDQVLRGETLHFHPIGAEASDNVSISTISVERPFDQPTAIQVFVALINSGPEEALCQIELSVNGNVPMGGVRDINIPGMTEDAATGAPVPGRRNFVFPPFNQPRDAVIVIRNLREDDLEFDNVAQIVVPPAKELSVALVNERSVLLPTALGGIALQRLDSITSAQYEALVESGATDRYDVYVMDGYAPEQLGDGRFFFIETAPPVEGLNVYGEGERQFVLDHRPEHPALRFVGFDSVFVNKAQSMEPSDEVKVLVEGNASPLLVELSRGPQRVMYLAFDPLESNWPLLPSFVTFIVNMIDYLGHSGEALTAEGLGPGDAITTRLPADATDIALATPDGQVHELTPGDPALFSWGPIRLTGLHTLTWSDAAGDRRREFAVNLLSDVEGMIPTRQQIEIGREEIAAADVAGSRYTPLWPWAVGVCLLVLTLEWWIYNKKTFL